MRQTIYYCPLFLLALALLLLSWGCATTRGTEIGNQEAAMQTDPQIVDDIHYTDKRKDANLSSVIRMKFAADDLLSGSDINVDTTNGNVTLNGNVDTQAEANRAMRLGRSVNGVRSVRSSLIVKSTT